MGLRCACCSRWCPRARASWGPRAGTSATACLGNSACTGRSTGSQGSTGTLAGRNTVTARSCRGHSRTCSGSMTPAPSAGVPAACNSTASHRRGRPCRRRPRNSPCIRRRSCSSGSTACRALCNIWSPSSSRCHRSRPPFPARARPALCRTRARSSPRRRGSGRGCTRRDMSPRRHSFGNTAFRATRSTGSCCSPHRPWSTRPTRPASAVRAPCTPRGSARTGRARWGRACRTPCTGPTMRPW
mmetsp:Transcript_121512/g.349228  ORF Transcript_121512/g.349228 Transcript_121512/m.349228 type:complete len:243 (-) Transcript_121512:702-1430(-)